MKFFRNSSIQRKLMLVIFCTSLFGLSLAGMVFEVYERASFRSALVSNLTGHRETLGLNTAAALAFTDRPKSILIRYGLFAARKRKQEALGAAHKRIPALIEPKREIGGAGDPDANGFADGAGGNVCFAEPERPGGAEIEAIMAAVNLKGGGEAAWTAGEIEKASGPAMSLHQLDALEGFKSADENGRGDSGSLADDV